MRAIKIEHTSLTDIGLVREANEDSCGSIDGANGPVFTVCDGMGGHVGGAIASGIAVKSILEFITMATVENPSVCINNAIISANQKILEAVRERPDLQGMGTTATVLTVQSGGVYIGHVGDSRIYIFSNGRLHRLTNDHSYVQSLIDAGALTPDEAEKHPRKNELTNAMGVLDTVQPTIIKNPIKPRPGDIFLLCTDGLCGLVNDLTIEQIIANVHNLDQAARQLIQVAKSAGGYDNITVQLIKVIESPYNQSAFESYSPVRKYEGPHSHGAPPVKKRMAALFEKGSNRTALLICFLFIVGLAGAYFILRPPVPDNTTPDVTENTTALLPGDSMNGDYLIHTRTNATEALDKLIADRKKADNNSYKQFDFDSTYAIDGVVKVDSKSYHNYDHIKWKKKKEDTAAIEDVDKITVKADQQLAPRATANKGSNDSHKNTTPPNKKLALEEKYDALDSLKLLIDNKEKQIRKVMDSLEKKKVRNPEKHVRITELEKTKKTLKDKQTILEKQIKAINDKAHR